MGVTARHATAAAVCTGVSLLLVPLLLWLLKPTTSLPASQSGLAESSKGGAPMFALLAMVLAVVTPLIGTGLGISAVCNIRRSNGQRLGFIRSMFGALAWPVLFILGAVGVLIARVFEMTGSKNDLLSLVVAVLAGTRVAALLVSRVAKWARGETRLKETALEATNPTARFANASFICTALSLIPAGLVSIILSHGHNPGWYAQLSLMFFLLPLVILAGLGIGLATRCLRQIRDSEGRLSGTKRAKFAALTWPWLSIVLLSSAGFFTLFDENVLGMKWKLPVGLLLITSSVLGVVM
ncbi:MAG: hypothetical protein ACOVOX_15950, partial [Burkholderiaceae bacterium]